MRAKSEPERRIPKEQLLKDNDVIAWHLNRVKWLVGKDSVVDLIFILAPD